MQELINKITHGDCLEVMKTIADKSIDLVLTDPPYNASNSNISCNDKNYSALNVEWDKNFNPSDFLNLCYDKLKVNGSMLVFCSYHLLKEYLSFDKIKIQQIIHWQKTNPFPAIAKIYTPNIEYCIWYVKGSPYVFNKKESGHNIIITSMCSGNERGEHPTQKPLKLFKKLLQVHSNENDLVLDCFSGSGTTAIACSELKRNFICIEKDKHYYEASVQRLENYNKQLKLF